MALYTMLLDYAGGTYVSQSDADNEREALFEWVRRLRSERIADGISDEMADAFQGATHSNLAALGGVVGVWCATATGREGLALVNVVATAS
jgi:hypothetical protein